jgi:hypothetical protein
VVDVWLGGPECEFRVGLQAGVRGDAPFRDEQVIDGEVEDAWEGDSGVFDRCVARQVEVAGKVNLAAF